MLIDGLNPAGISVSNDGKTIIVTLSEPLSTNEVITVIFSKNLTISGKPLGNDLQTFFNANGDADGISDIAFKVGGKTLHYAYEIKPNDTVQCNFTFSDIITSPFVLIASVYEGDRLVSIDAVDVSDSTRPASIDITIPSRGSDFKIECISIDDFINRSPLSKVWGLK